MKVTRTVDFVLNITSDGIDKETDTNEVMQKPKRTFGTPSFGTNYRELAVYRLNLNLLVNMTRKIVIFCRQFLVITFSLLHFV